MNSDAILASRLQHKANKFKPRYLGPIEFEGEKIAQFHNPNLFIKDILGENETKQFTSILIIGSPGTGKTTLATFIAHECHTEKPGYFIVHLGKKELLNFSRIMDSLPNQNIILIFDDVSLIFKHIKDPTKRTEILTTLTEARHPKLVEKDRQVMVIACIHYVNSIEKMWRSQGGWKIYTDMSTEEIQNFNYMTKSKFKRQVERFSAITMEQFRKKQFTVSLTNKQTRTYTTNKPFRFIMAYDSVSPRFFLTPNKSCNLCSSKTNKHSKVKAEPNDIIKLAEKYYKGDGIKGLKNALLLSGQTAQFRNNEVYATNTAQEILGIFDVDPEELSLILRKNAKISDKRVYTIRKKKIDFIADLEEIQKNEGNITFASQAILDAEKEEKLLDDEEEKFDENTKAAMEQGLEEDDDNEGSERENGQQSL